MKHLDFVSQQLNELAEVSRNTASQAEQIVAVAELVMQTVGAGGKLLYAGNGGSAADAQHIATEYVVRFRRNRAPVAALALTTDSSLITAAANDFGFDTLFERQVRALGKPGDLLFLHSTSGESQNLINAAVAARETGVKTVGLLGRGGGRLLEHVDHAIVIPSANGAHTQELHLAVSHIICELVETRLFERAERAH